MRKVSVYKHFNDLPASYRQVFEDASHSSGFFFSFHWFNHLIASSFDKNISLRIYGVEGSTDQTKPSLALAMYFHVPSIKFISPQKLLPVANYYTSLFGPVTVAYSKSLEEDLTLLIQMIVTERPRWDMVDFHPLDKSSPSFTLLKNIFQKQGMAVQTYFCFGNWYLDVNGKSFKEYFETLPARLKKTISRKTKKMNDSIEWEIKIVSTSTELAKYIAIFEAIYNSSWKNPEPYPDFIPGLIRICAEQGWLRLGIAYIDSKPAAAQIWIVHNGVASIYKLAYIDKYSQYSIGTILTARLMEHVIDTDKAREVDYLTGDDEYKKDWMSHRRERWGLIAFNLRTPTGILAAIKHLGGNILKRTLKLNNN